MKCENCGNEHDGSYGSGRFCSKHCRMQWIGRQTLKSRDASWKSPFCNPKNRRFKKSPYGRWKCETCDIIFDTKNLLYKHKHSVHGLKNGAWNKGHTKDTDDRLKQISIKLTGRKYPGKGTGRVWTIEQKKAMSNRIKEYYKQHPEKHPARRLSNNRNKMTYGERIAYDWLSKNNIEFIRNFHFNEHGVNRYVDFYVQSKNLFIEIDGEFWHNKRKELDNLKDKIAEEYGIKTIRIPAKENIEKSLDKIFNSSIC